MPLSRKKPPLTTNHIRENQDINFAFKAVIGIAPPVIGVLTSFQEQIERHLRVGSLSVGLVVGVMSLVSMARKWRTK